MLVSYNSAGALLSNLPPSPEKGSIFGIPHSDSKIEVNSSHRADLIRNKDKVGRCEVVYL